MRRKRRVRDTDGDRSHHRFSTIEQFEEWLAHVADARLSRQRAFAGGNWTALYDAIAQAIDTDDGDDEAPVSIPRWAAEALLEQALPKAMLAMKTPERQAARRRGRPPARWDAAQWRRDAIDWQRYLQVWYRRIAQRESSSRIPAGSRAQKDARRAYQQRQAANGSSYIVDLGTPYPWSAGSHPDDWSVFEAVAKIFERSIYRGSPAEVKKSWERVTAALKSGGAWRYYPSKWLRYDERQMLTAEADQVR